jgi:hypothetical protein
MVGFAGMAAQGCPVEKLVELKTAFRIAFRKDRSVGLALIDKWLLSR